MTNGEVTYGLPPVAGRAPCILLLGSFPSEKALQTGEYYANRRNQFWPLCQALFGVDAALPYAERVAALTSRQVALWDVLRAGERTDTGIDLATAQPNDLLGFLAQHPSIRTIGLNGRIAESAFQYYFPSVSERGVRVLALPSSRGVIEPLDLADKLQAWSALTAPA